MEKDNYSRIVARIREFAVRWRALLVCEGLAYTAAFVALFVILSFVSDNLFHFSPLLRGGVLFLLFIALVSLLYVRVVQKFLMRITPERAAIYIESRLGEFDNKLINALQLGKKQEYLDNEIINALILDAHNEVKRRSLRRSLDLRRIRKSIAVLGVAALALLVYWLLFGNHLQNALARFSNLANGPLPITRVSLSVTPGDVMVFRGDDLEVSARTTDGPLPEAAYLARRFPTKTRTEMEFNGESFQLAFHGVRHGFRYRIEAEDFKSPWYRVVVREPLRVERVNMILRFPEYLGIPDTVEVAGAGSEVRVLGGTTAKLHIFTNKEVRQGHLLVDNEQRPLSKRSPTELVGELVITDDVAYRIRMKSNQGKSTNDSLVRKILSFEDLPPTIEILEPRESAGYTGTGEDRLTIIVKASDDVALSSIRILMEAVHTDQSAESITIEQWAYNSGTNDSLSALKRAVIETADVQLLDHLEAGQSALLFAAATDMKGNESFSSKTRVSLVSRALQTELERAEKESIFRQLREILNAQLQSRLLVEKSNAPEASDFQSAREQQADIHSQTLALIDRLNQATQLDYSHVKTTLLGLSTNEMVDVIKQMNAPSTATFSEAKVEILSLQDRVILALRQLLGELAEEEKPPPEEKLSPPEDKPLDDALSRLRELETILKNFIAEQKKVITSSLELQEKKPADYTQDDHDLKRKLQIVEDQWAKFLKEESIELGKIPEQDFSDPTLLKELRQIYEEIEVAADELSKPGTRIPVTEEQVGLELAEKLEHNLESWLPEESDKIKWELEEPSTPPDVPMAELPEELEDIMGDLIREEEYLDPEMEDVSSSWMDSIDAGAGWDTMDGPISNMSAKGKTGNTLPNSSEISGRSAEGRTGKSNGEFVSDTALGKGGRRTPTRVMNDPYENATIDDRMTQPTGGATGGGKRSGAGGEGLRGHIPPDLQTTVADVRRKQADLISRGERILHDFNRLNLNTEKLDETIDKMRRMERNMERFKYTDLAAAHEEIIEDLKSAQEITSHDWKIRREQEARLPVKVRKILNDTLNTEFPRDYEALLREYYKAISQ